MAKDTVIEIVDSDSSQGSNGDNLIGTVIVPFLRSQFDSEGSSARRALPIIHTPSNDPGQTSRKQKAPLVAPPFPPPSKRSKTPAGTVFTSPPPPLPSEAETGAPSIRRRTTSLRINSSNANLRPELSATLAATLCGERRLNRLAGVTYSRPYGGGSKPVPLAAITSSNPNNRGSATPRSVGASSSQPHHQIGAVVIPSQNHTRLRQNSEKITVDFLSQMETENPAPVQIQRGNPPSVAMRAAWGETLTLGNRGGRQVNLSLRLGFRA